jgi:ribonuclease P protein component
MPTRFTLPKSRRLHSREDFSAVYEAKVRESRGPLMVYAKPNSKGYTRMGLSTSRKVGNAPRRNRIRRMLREAFRHLQHDLPVGYDLLVVVRAHEPMPLLEYQKLLTGIAARLHSMWDRRPPATRSES